MIGTAVRRGVAAGFLAGILTGLVGLVAGASAIDVAAELEASGEPTHDAGGEASFTRTQQKAGLVLGSGIVGLGVGALFGVAAAWAAGRVTGDAWTRSIKLGATALGAAVLVPMAAYPPNPPGVGDPDTVGLRTTLYLGALLVGLLLAAAAWVAARQLAGTSLPAPARQSLVGTATVATAVLIVWMLPGTGVRAHVPADLLWEFRVGALATQATLFTATAVLYGLLASRREHARPADPATLLG